jgi:hypothetical protein
MRIANFDNGARWENFFFEGRVGFRNPSLTRREGNSQHLFSLDLIFQSPYTTYKIATFIVAVIKFKTQRENSKNGNQKGS